MLVLLMVEGLSGSGYGLEPPATLHTAHNVGIVSVTMLTHPALIPAETKTAVPIKLLL